MNKSIAGEISNNGLSLSLIALPICAILVSAVDSAGVSADVGINVGTSSLAAVID